MSRIGKEPIPIPKGVNVTITGQKVVVKGGKGSLDRVVRDEIEILLQDDVVLVNTRDDSQKTNAFRGLFRSLINNMIIGVDQGFQKKLIIEGVGYKANVSGSTLTLNVGYSNPVEFAVPDGINATMTGNTGITLESIDKELLGLTAAKIRSVRKPEPYKGKGIRYENEYVARKVGKSGAK
ncbi:MAG: 50S ribosomal protein L6 [Desulfobulbaceae bacterium]|uniref:Large ribosomal subunit protein uL6 n=1 Tax=Candidatus Desulfatifera sulfidica TaxID=2841691 RepID=A0A8J6N9F2_9BACT|nr:50S ribosomal protein L6 [Candidatus Desulfatifera sulfidica]